jgi:hypothetical protein
MNRHIIAVTGQSCRPSDQGLVEDMNKLVKRVIGSVLTKQRLVGNDPNWTEVLGLVATAINSQHGRGKDDVSFYEAVYSQLLEHGILCSMEEARQCWTLSQLLKVANKTKFNKYAAVNYICGEGSSDVDKDDLGYFSNESLPEDAKDEVMDEEFLKHLHENDSLGGNGMRRRHEDEFLKHQQDNHTLGGTDRKRCRKVNFNEAEAKMQTSCWVLMTGNIPLTHFLMIPCQGMTISVTTKLVMRIQCHLWRICPSISKT